MTATPATEMGNWVVVVEYQSDGRDDYDIIRDAGRTKAEALEVLRALIHTYLPRPRIVEKWRQVYRFTDGESYVVLIKGSVTQWRCTLRVAELISDSTDPVVGRRAQATDAAAEVAADPQDRIPPRQSASTQLDPSRDQLGG